MMGNTAFGGLRHRMLGLSAAQHFSSSATWLFILWITLLGMLGVEANLTSVFMPESDLEALEGKTLRIKAGHSFLVSILYPSAPSLRRLWFNTSLAPLLSRMEEDSSFSAVFGASRDSGASSKLAEMLEVLQNTPGWDGVRDRVFVLKDPLDIVCTPEKFPDCPVDISETKGKGILVQHLASQGSIMPRLIAKWSPQEEMTIEAKPDSGWLPSIKQLTPGSSPLSYALSDWGGQACSESDYDFQGKAVLIKAGGCTAFQKVSRAVQAGAKAVIIADDAGSSGIEELSCRAPDPCGSAHLQVPAMMISAFDAEKLRAKVGLGEVTVEVSSFIQGKDLVGIDHHLRLREVGSIAYGKSLESLAQEVWRFIGLEAMYFSYEKELEKELGAYKELGDHNRHPAEGLSVVVLDGDKQDGSAENPFFGGGSGLHAQVDLPPASQMAVFNRMKVFLKLECTDGRDASCGPWDYTVKLMLCEGDKCALEIGRWVTALGRPGKWITEADIALPQLKSGGMQKFHIFQPNWWSSQRYRTTVKLLFAADKTRQMPVSTTPLFVGGLFDATYNYKQPEMTLDIPLDASRIEIHAFITGHGWGKDQANCAEFCETQHRFIIRPTVKVAEAEYALVEGGIYEHGLTGTEDPLGCAASVGRGVTPNQYSEDWVKGRAGWCPGGSVTPVILDISPHVTRGARVIISYRGLYNGSDYEPKPCQGVKCVADSLGFGAQIKMTSYLMIFHGGKAETIASAYSRDIMILAAVLLLFIPLISCSTALFCKTLVSSKPDIELASLLKSQEDDRNRGFNASTHLETILETGPANAEHPEMPEQESERSKLELQWEISRMQEELKGLKNYIQRLEGTHAKNRGIMEQGKSFLHEAVAAVRPRR